MKITKIILGNGKNKACDNCGENLFYFSRGYSRKYTNKQKTEGVESARYINTCTNCGWKDYQTIYENRKFTLIHHIYRANSYLA